MKKSLFIFLLIIVTVLTLISVGANIYLIADKFSNQKIVAQTLPEKGEVAGISITPTQIEAVPANINCLQKSGDDKYRNIDFIESNNAYSVIASTARISDSSIRLHNVAIQVFDVDCKVIETVKYNSFKLAGANAVNSIKIKEGYVEVDYHINPNASIIRVHYFGNKDEDFFTSICRPDRPDICEKKKMQFSVKYTSDDAIKIIQKRSEVKAFSSKVKTVSFNSFDSSEDEALYLVQVFENLPDHTATFGWYTLNKYTGEIESLPQN